MISFQQKAERKSEKKKLNSVSSDVRPNRTFRKRWGRRNIENHSFGEEIVPLNLRENFFKRITLAVFVSYLRFR